MYHKFRSILLMLMLFMTLASSLPVAAQDTQTPSTGLRVEGVTEANAPDNGDIVLTDEEKAEIAFLESITDAQLAELETIITKYSSQLDSLFHEETPIGSDETALAEKVFLPLISGSSSSIAAESESATNIEETAVTESDVIQKTELIMAQIDQEFAALLTSEQQALFQKTPLAQVDQEIQSSSVQDVTSISTCYWGGRYGARGYYYAAGARYYATLDWQRVNNIHSYNNYYYNRYAHEKGITGSIYAGGAYMMAVQSLDPGNWDETAVNYLTQARTNADWGRYYAKLSQNKGSAWGKAAYAQANLAYYFFNLGVSNMNSC